MKTALIVEDHDPTALLLREQLGFEGFGVHATEEVELGGAGQVPDGGDVEVVLVHEAAHDR